MIGATISRILALVMLSLVVPFGLPSYYSAGEPLVIAALLWAFVAWGLFLFFAAPWIGRSITGGSDIPRGSAGNALLKLGGLLLFASFLSPGLGQLVPKITTRVPFMGMLDEIIMLCASLIGLAIAALTKLAEDDDGPMAGAGVNVPVAPGPRSALDAIDPDPR